jgi:hypothetical protein
MRSSKKDSGIATLTTSSLQNTLSLLLSYTQFFALILFSSKIFSPLQKKPELFTETCKLAEPSHSSGVCAKN